MAKKSTYEELEGKVQFYEEAIGEARKQIMKALRENGLWNPEFHQQELVAITAIFLATKKTLDAKEKALHLAIEFIGKFEGDQMLGHECYDTLDKINRLIAGESLEETMNKKVK